MEEKPASSLAAASTATPLNTTATGTGGTTRPPRPSPRWREPLVEEFHPPPAPVPTTAEEERHGRYPHQNGYSRRTAPTTAATAWYDENGTRNGGGGGSANRGGMGRTDDGTPATTTTTTTKTGTTTTKTFRTNNGNGGGTTRENGGWGREENGTMPPPQEGERVEEEHRQHHRWRRERRQRHFVDEQREEETLGGGGVAPNGGGRRAEHDGISAAEEERPFFSEEFYRAFPHLRPTSSGSGASANAATSMGTGSQGSGGTKYYSREPHFAPRPSPAAFQQQSPPPEFFPKMPEPRWTKTKKNNGSKEFSSYLDRFDRNWRDDPFWRDLYPRWAEPIFKDGIDVKTSITNDNQRFAVDIDTYQFRPEELQVKTMDDTLLIEGRHEDVRDRDNYTKMYFVRKYQLPTDVDPLSIGSHVDSRGHLTVEAQKRWPAIEGRERSIPIESPSGRRYGSPRSSSYSPRDRYYYDSGRGSANDYYRAESRQDGGASGGGGTYLSPQPDRKSNGYRTEFEQRKTDANGMRHEARREEFREEVRRSGSGANVLPPPVPVYRTSSRLSANAAAADAGAAETRSESHFRRTSSSQRNEYRQYSNGGGAEHLLRPAEEFKSTSAFGRSVPIQRA